MELPDNRSTKQMGLCPENLISQLLALISCQIKGDFYANISRTWR